MIDPVWWAGLAMVGAVLATTWRWLLMAKDQLTSLVLIRLSCDEGHCEAAVLNYLQDNASTAPPSWDRLYTIYTTWVGSNGRYRLVPFEKLLNKQRLFWIGWRPFLVQSSRKKGPGETPGSNEPVITVMTLRPWFCPKTFIVEAARAYERYSDKMAAGKNLKITRIAGRGSRRGRDYDESPREARRVDQGPDPFKAFKVKALDELGLEVIQGTGESQSRQLSEDQEKVVQLAREWVEARQWYQRRRVPWRTGLLLCGLPGCGKTAAVRAIGEVLGLPICSLDITSMSDEEFISAFEETNTLNTSGYVMLIEDIDSAFDNRTSLGEVSFSCLLNTLDGVQPNDGMLLVITTNHPEKLDPAVRGRKGRLDHEIVFREATEVDRRKIIGTVLADFEPFERASLVRTTAGMNVSELQARCCELALERLRKQKGDHVHEG